MWGFGGLWGSYLLQYKCQFKTYSNNKSLRDQNTMQSEVYGPVLLVCIYNKFGNIITHDYFYQLFSQYGDIVKILIFQKAKVWKTFIQFTAVQSARLALANLNGHVVFEDGSKMNIFSSKLKNIKLQNTNLGGVDYQQLKIEEPELDFLGTRGRRSTTQQPTHTLSYCHEYYSNHGKSSTAQIQSTFSFTSAPNHIHSQKSYNSFDIESQFLEIARQSQEFRQIQKEEVENFRSSNRRKSKTTVNNPNLQQFVLQNSPSKVLFVRSIPAQYTNKCLYNIFRNFGNVLRVIYMKDKASGLIEYQTVASAITAKDQLNYVKAQMKIFYSHYQTLSLRKQAQGEQFEEYSRSSRSLNINPPSQILYLTMANPTQETEIKQKFQEIGCPILQVQWKMNGKDRWMGLADVGTIEKSLLVMGVLQGVLLSTGKELRLSFTRSKIHRNYQPKIDNNQ